MDSNSIIPRGLFPLLLLVGVLLFLISACGGGQESPTDNVYVFVQSQFAEPATSSGFQTLLAGGTVAEVESLWVEVLKNSDQSQVLAPTALTESAPDVNDWSGTLSGLPVGVALDFIGNAYKTVAIDAGNEIFTDTVTQTLTLAGPNDISLMMESVDVQPTLPVIVSATMSEEVGIGSTGNLITFAITHPDGEVTYTASVVSGAITSGASGTLAVGTDTLDVTYDAPATGGTDSITLTVWYTATPEATVSATYPITVAGAQASLTVTFGPVITDINFLRTETALEISVVEVSDATTPTIAWSGVVTDGTTPLDLSTMVGAATDTATVAGFTDTHAGDVTFTVIDEVTSGGTGISASLTQTIAAGDFPYVLIVDLGPPTNAAVRVTFTDVDLDGSQIEGIPVFMLAADESDVTEYRLYWGQDATTKLAGNDTVIDTVSVGGGTSFAAFAPNTAQPAGATHLLVFTANTDGEMSTGVSALIVDLGTGTLIDFEDFSEGLGNWLVYSGSPTVTAGELRLVSSSGNRGRVYYPTTIDPVTDGPLEVEFDLRKTSSSEQFFFQWRHTNDTLGGVIYTPSSYIKLFQGADETIFNGVNPSGGFWETLPTGAINWSVTKHVRMLDDGTRVQIWIDDVLKFDVDLAYPNDFPSAYIGFMNRENNYGGGTTYIDNVRITRY